MPCEIQICVHKNIYWNTAAFNHSLVICDCFALQEQGLVYIERLACKDWFTFGILQKKACQNLGCISTAFFFFNLNWDKQWIGLLICSRQYFWTHLKNYFIFVQLQLSAFSPYPSKPPQPNPPPSPASTLPLGFVHVSFIVVPENPSPHCPYSPPLWLLFLTSMSLVIFCLLFSFVGYVPVKGEIIWQFHCWYYTLRTLKHQSKRTYAPQCS